MSFLLAIRDDLVEKRLWPVAVALVLALIAVPVVLARGGAQPAPSAPLPDPTLDAAPVAGKVVRPLVLEKTSVAAPTGPAHDPFRALRGAAAPQAPAQDGVTVVTPDAPAAAADVSPSVAAGAGTPQPAPPAAAPAAPAAPVVPPPAGAPRSVNDAGYRVDLGWGPTSASRSASDVARLTPLESDGTPAVVFMGVRPDGRTALFLLLGDSPGSGDARCRPSADLCRLLEMRAGETQYLDVPTAGGIRQYELHVDRLHARRAPTPQAAQRLRTRVSKAGRALVAETIAAGRTFVRRYVYAASRGVVVFSEHASDKRAAAAAVGELQAVGGTPAQ